MYDDYDYKLTEKRIKFEFIQEDDISIYPWEVGRFINDLNTNYYKFELLNSISTALINDIDPQNIIILNKSLPLHKNYTHLDVIDAKNNGLSFIYEIGAMHSLSPSLEIAELSAALDLFRSFNSRLHGANHQPLSLKKLTALYESIKQNGIHSAPKAMLELVAKKKTKKKELPSFEKSILDFNSKIEGVVNQFKLSKLIDINDTEKNYPKDFPKGLPKKFFNYFEFLFIKLHRPVVLLKEEDQFRVLGRSLVNKSSKRIKGLELIEMPRNSPLRGIFEGGAAVYRTIQEEKRANELHEYEKKDRQLALKERALALEEQKARFLENRSIAAEKMKQEKLKTDALQKLNLELTEISEKSDVTSHEKLGNQYHEMQVKSLLKMVDNQTYSTINSKGFKLLPEKTEIKTIDITV
ncbi:hypothetical protein [Hydrogenovibrio thermophilus]|uniref:Uncharacterized protein n=1 Tax=Hydrogenovibrio thermophilus TaxID=265883 RepID=A0A410H290_9GAMM|nr:hypothetical protein [Hydrogenovibrio thermophilus]QAB15024.1 hypothetical protein EPV75_04725 [Hydrogenovibrio thermophilus]